MSTIISGDQFINQGWLQPGESMLEHDHDFPHNTIFYGPGGRAEALEVIERHPDGRPKEFRVERYCDCPGPDRVLITAHTWHRLINTGTAPLRYECFFVPRNPMTGEVEPMNHWYGALH